MYRNSIDEYLQTMMMTTRMLMMMSI